MKLYKCYKNILSDSEIKLMLRLH